LIPYRLTSLAIGLAIAFTILWLVRRDLIHTRYSIWWLVVAGASALLGGFPFLVDGVASRLGVTYPPILLVIVGMGLLLIKMLTMDVERSDQERRLRILIQRLAILEGEGPLVQPDRAQPLQNHFTKSSADDKRDDGA
jgi:Uncharacterized conserved protein (DUF2304)